MDKFTHKTILHVEDSALNKQRKRKHSDEKPYKCTVSHCKRKFSRYNNMIQHTKTHPITATSSNNDTVPDLVKSKKKRLQTIKNKKKRQQQQEEHVTMLMNELFLLSDSSLLTSDEEVEYDDDDNEKHMMILPHLANYLLSNPNEPPESYLKTRYHCISIQESLYPMESLLLLQKRQNNAEKDAYYYVTMDEFEALQGLTQFYTCNQINVL